MAVGHGQFLVEIMSKHFQWQTEEDERAWQDQPPEPAKAAPIQRPWRILLLLFVALLLTGLLLYWRLNQRAEAAAAAVQTDVLAAHNLMRQAAAQRDADLFRTLLSGRDPAWTEAQVGLVEAGLLLNRAPMGLRLLTNAPQNPARTPPDSQPLITIAPDLLSAVVHFTQPYALAVSSTTTQTVTLTHTALYRRGADRWLLSPPEPDARLDRLSSQAQHLTLIYPQRDQELARRLLRDLDHTLANLCQAVQGLICPFNLHVTLRLDDDPGLIGAMTPAVPVRVLDGTWQINLPAPYLVGLPVDEAGYQALARGYSAQLASAVITHLVAYTCCDHLPVYQALLDYQLSQLNLRSWPVTAAHYQRVLDEQASLEALAPYWDSTDPAVLAGEDGWLLYTAIDFLLHSPPSSPSPQLRAPVREITPALMQSALPLSQSLPAWLGLLLVDGADFSARTAFVDNLDRNWRFFAYAQNLTSQAPPAIPLPAQDIHLLCTGWDLEEGTEKVVLHRYNPAQDTWTAERTSTGFTFMNPLPNDDGVLLNAFVGEFEGWQTHLWRNGQGTRVHFTTEAALSLGQTDRQGRHFLSYQFDTALQRIVPRRIDLEACNVAGCQQHALAGLPFWSPSGAHTILVTDPWQQDASPDLLLLDGRSLAINLSAPPRLSSLLLGDSLGQPVAVEGDDTGFVNETRFSVGRGYAPFWIDDETYGYVRATTDTLPIAEQEVVLATIRDNEPITAVTLNELLAAASLNEQPAQFVLRYVLVHPRHPHLLFIVVLDTFAQQAYLFSFNRQTHAIALLLQAGYTPNHSLGFSPDGRWLTFTGLDSDALGPGVPSPTLYLYDIARHEIRQFFFTNSLYNFASIGYDWSADGQWLAFMLGDNMIALVAPNADYQQRIQHNYGACTSLAWINRIE